jgi:hypothetical protein
MAYEAQMIALAKGAMKLHGNLQAVLFLKNDNKDSMLIFSDGTALPVAYRFHGYDIRSEGYAFPVAAQIGGTDPFSLLTFGYSGTGPECYATFLNAAGFVNANVKDVRAPLRLTVDGKRIGGARLQAKWTAEISAKSLDEARKKIEPPRSADSCILLEEVLCDGTAATLVVTVDTASASDAERTARARVPVASEILGIEVSDKKTSQSEKIKAFSETDAVEQAKKLITALAPSCKTLAGVSCTQKARKGFFGIGKTAGKWEAKYDLSQKEVTIRYAAPLRIKVHYGPKKLLCNKCGSVMSTTSEGVFVVGANSSAKAPVLKLRCEKCDITRVEKRTEIEGEWISWEDGTTTPL